LVSGRRLVEHCSLRLAIRYSLGYEVDEDLPWPSTLSRTRQLYPAAVFEQLFGHVFAQRVAAGLVIGYTQAVNSAFVKANASLESPCEKQPAAPPTPILDVSGELAPPDPSARISVKPGKALTTVIKPLTALVLVTDLVLCAVAGRRQG